MPDDDRFMRTALELAARGQGLVEPNPMVGCVLVQDGQIVGQGWHRRFGGPHAEVEALRDAGANAAGATMYVTLEPCCHHGKTPPCTDAVIDAGVRRVVVAMTDPFPQVAGGGLERLKQANIEIHTGVLESEAQRLNDPYLCLLKYHRPWVIAKWAMTLDGKIATWSQDSKWISNERSRAVVHQLRGRVDAIIVGRGTVEADDPQLTARPPGPRVATRVVCDRQASLPIGSNLVRSARETPVMLWTGPSALPSRCQSLSDAGCEVARASSDEHVAGLRELLAELGSRRMTNVLVEGGAKLLGTFLEADLIDEVHVFVAPKLIGGGQSATTGRGVEFIADATRLDHVRSTNLDGDLHISGRVVRR
ncbi:MAG: bifunctional diaminohydroxyphosphoribosylaminopyrimidine deaminase/5-amino-6-(5-phosphoribosylamino)uracil reductase RibD [Pirellulaceae bacterium]